MKLNELSASDGARKAPFRKGRGVGSGNGKTAGRGHKGQNSRSGGGVRLGFEGGQMPLFRRIPKRGFNNKTFALKFVEVNVCDLEDLENGAVVDAALLKEKRIINYSSAMDGIRVLGVGNLTKKLTVKASGFTATAKDKIEKAGGVAEEV
ncbi:MAG: 50S ribosomal protein L15 [Saccharofermentanales bacterium]